MDQPMDRRTDGWTDKVGCRVAQHATKNELFLAFLWTVELKNPTGNLSCNLKFCMDLLILLVSLCARFHTFNPKNSFSRKKTPKFVILVFLGIICQKSHTQNRSKAILSSFGIVFAKFQTHGPEIQHFTVKKGPKCVFLSLFLGFFAKKSHLTWEQKDKILQGYFFITCLQNFRHIVQRFSFSKMKKAQNLYF